MGNGQLSPMLKVIWMTSSMVMVAFCASPFVMGYLEMAIHPSRDRPPQRRAFGRWLRQRRRDLPASAPRHDASGF